MEHNLNAIKDEYSENEILGIKNMNKYEKKKMVEKVSLKNLRGFPRMEGWMWVSRYKRPIECPSTIEKNLEPHQGTSLWTLE